LKSIELGPVSPKVFLALAICEWNMGQQEKAENAMESVCRQSAGQKKLDKYLNFFRAANAEITATEGFITYEELLKVDRTRAAPFLKLAYVYLEQEELTKGPKILYVQP